RLETAYRPVQLLIGGGVRIAFRLEPGEHLEVDAHRERRAAPCDHQGPHRVVAGPVGHGLREVLPHVRRQRIELVRTVQPRPSDVAAALDADVRVAHQPTVSEGAVTPPNGTLPATSPARRSAAARRRTPGPPGARGRRSTPR